MQKKEKTQKRAVDFGHEVKSLLLSSRKLDRKQQSKRGLFWLTVWWDTVHLGGGGLEEREKQLVTSCSQSG